MTEENPGCGVCQCGGNCKDKANGWKGHGHVIMLGIFCATASFVWLLWKDLAKVASVLWDYSSVHPLCVVILVGQIFVVNRLTSRAMKGAKNKDTCFVSLICGLSIIVSALVQCLGVPIALWIEAAHPCTPFLVARLERIEQKLDPIQGVLKADRPAPPRPVEALVKMGTNAIPYLAKVVKQDNFSQTQKAWAIEALGLIGEKNGADLALPSLTRFLTPESENEFLTQLAIRAIGTIGPPARSVRPNLIALMDKGDGYKQDTFAIGRWALGNLIGR